MFPIWLSGFFTAGILMAIADKEWMIAAIFAIVSIVSFYAGRKEIRDGTRRST